MINMLRTFKPMPGSFEDHNGVHLSEDEEVPYEYFLSSGYVAVDPVGDGIQSDLKCIAVVVYPDGKYGITAGSLVNDDIKGLVMECAMN